MFLETPWTALLIIINLLVSGYALLIDPSLIDRWAFRPLHILRAREYYRMITAGFVHVGWAHLAFNMITLFFFGRPMEVLLGPVRFLLIYFGAELAGHGLSLWLHRHRPTYAAVGASGAISGLLFGYCLFFPFDRIYLFFFPVGIPAVLFAIGYVVLSIYAVRRGIEEGGIAHEAHLGGAVGGLLLTLLLEPRALPIFLRQLGL
ncbi:MAG: rhomboid family intramembrane serine protease [Rhodothermus sp.]|nr:rhomboid family intramembrane serine protease [Rhodothermus sp.]